MRAVLTWWSAATFVVLWVRFLIVVVANSDGVAGIEEWFQRQPIVARVVLWVLFLPIEIGVKTWTSPSAAIRWRGVVALVIWTVASIASVNRLVTA